MLIDTHAHLYWDSFKEDFDEVIKRCIEAKVTTLINVGVDVEKSKKALQVSEKLVLSGVEGYSTIGIHPHEYAKYFSHKSQGTRHKLKADIEKLEHIFLNHKDKIVGVGECGLDYFLDPEFTPANPSLDEIKQLQRQLFQAQIDLAKKLNLPLIVHCRDDRSKDPENSEAWDEVLQMIGSHPTILHCYSGLSKTTEKVLKMPNIIVSFAATITYPKNEYLREAAKLLPLDRIVLETDCPFLPPQSRRGQRNEPATVTKIAQLIADLKGLPFEKIAEQTTANVKKILRLT